VLSGICSVVTILRHQRQLAQACALLSAVLIVAVMSRFHEHDVHKAFAACVTLYRSRARGRPDWLTEPMELPSGTPE